MTDLTLKPCPNCASNAHVEWMGPYAYVQCNDEDCGTMGPTRPSAEEAAATWNQRPIEDALSEALATVTGMRDLAVAQSQEAMVVAQALARRVVQWPEVLTVQTALAVYLRHTNDPEANAQAAAVRDRLSLAWQQRGEGL